MNTKNIKDLVKSAVTKDDQTILCFFQSRERARQGLKDIVEVIQDAKIEFAIRKNELEIHFPNDSKIILQNNVDRIRGLQVDVAFVDDVYDLEILAEINSRVTPHRNTE